MNGGCHYSNTERFSLAFRKGAGSGEESLPLHPFQGEHASPSVDDVDDDLGVLPVVILVFVHIELGAANFA